jgi:hypothetical protein
VIAPAIPRSEVTVDHVIFYAAEALDELAAFFEDVGFTLTPLGRHNSGSVNRLAILHHQYIELMAFEPGTPAHVRPELRAMAPGLNGIVATDTPQLRRSSDEGGFNPPVELSRPVASAPGEGLARFTITGVREAVPDVRLFLCRHHTPELVWQEDWSKHANGSFALDRIAVATRHSCLLHRALQTVFAFRADARASAYDAAGTRIEVLAHGLRASLSVRTSDLAPVMGRVRRRTLRHTVISPNELALHLPAPYEADLIFTSNEE